MNLHRVVWHSPTQVVKLHIWCSQMMCYILYALVDNVLNDRLKKHLWYINGNFFHLFFVAHCVFNWSVITDC